MRQAGLWLRLKQAIVRVRVLVSLAYWPLRYGPMTGMQRVLDYIVISRSGEFDSTFYLQENPHIRTVSAHPLKHFVLFGSANLRNPNSAFCTEQYMRENFAQWKRENAFAHYLKNGANPQSHPISAKDRKEGSPLKIVVLAWDLGHNPAGRAYLLAESLSRSHQVELWGANFPRFGSELWEPIAGSSAVTIRRWKGCNLPEYSNVLFEQLAKLDCDLLYICKPRLPSVAFGVLAKQIHNIPVVLDIDDHELSFFNHSSVTPMSQAILEFDASEHANPHDQYWTQACESLVSFADHITVSNETLQRRFGGTVVPHIRDEQTFFRDLQSRNEIRAELAYIDSDRVLVFAGTPRLHKGLKALYDALESLQNPAYKMLVIGTPLDPLTEEFLKNCSKGRVQHLNNVAFSQLPKYLSAADLMCLLQDPASAVSQYQLPAKTIDALAMEIPLLVSNVPPFKEYIEAGLAIAVDQSTLASSIDHVFKRYDSYQAHAQRARKRFEHDFSYAAYQKIFGDLFYDAREQSKPLNAEALELANFMRSLSSETVSEKLPPYISPPSPSLQEKPKRYNVVYFWKQNDSGIYGRRQDMLVKYLLEDSRVNKVLHFDLPMSITALRAQYKRGRADRASQSSMVFKQTVQRLRRSSTRPDLRQRTYLYGRAKISVPNKSSVYKYVFGYAKYVHREMQSFGFFDPEYKTIFIVCPLVPEFPYLLNTLTPDVLVADVIDNHLKWNQFDPEFLEQNYHGVLGAADIVITNSHANRDEMLSFAEDITVIPNAAEKIGQDEYAALTKPELIASLEGPIIGYSGNLDNKRIDIELLQLLARSLPDSWIVLIGSQHANIGDAAFGGCPNILTLGTMPHQETLRYMKHFSVAIVPHLDNELTASMDPLKLYVYLSMGVPVVSTKVAINPTLEKLINVAENHQEFLVLLQKVIELDAQSSKVQLQSKLPETEYWPNRVARLLELVDEQS